MYQESQTLKLNKEQFNLSDVILYIIEDFRNNIEQKEHGNIELIYEAVKNNNNQYQDLQVQADKARITQVISNLLTNGIKHTKEAGGVISITAAIQQSMENNTDNKVIVVSMKDTGKGIDSDIMSILFTKFASKSEHGTGLGLYICKSIVEAHGGRIWAQNNNIRNNGNK